MSNEDVKYNVSNAKAKLIMGNSVGSQRWEQAQASEQSYWDVIDVVELLRICAEKPRFLQLFSSTLLSEFFDGKEVQEIGCGPLAVSIASFYPRKSLISHLQKVEPLPRIRVSETAAAKEEWAKPFTTWVSELSDEGQYLQLPGESLEFDNRFDTVITYNVLDHVQAPEKVLSCAFNSLRKGGILIVGVDCLSFCGRIRFEHITRKLMKGSVLADAHPHSFLPGHVFKMLRRTGFDSIKSYGLQGRLKWLLGSHYRPAFVARKP